MYYIYVQVLLQGQAYGSCHTFREPLSKNFHVVLDHGLDARLVVHVLDEFLGGFGSHSIRLALISHLASKEILYIYRRDVSNHYFKNIQSMRCIEQCSVRKTYPKLGLDTLRLVHYFSLLSCVCSDLGTYVVMFSYLLQNFPF